MMFCGFLGWFSPIEILSRFISNDLPTNRSKAAGGVEKAQDLWPHLGAALLDTAAACNSCDLLIPAVIPPSLFIFPMRARNRDTLRAQMYKKKQQ